MQIETLEVRLAGSARGDPGGVGLAADLDDTGAGARPERDAPLDRSSADARQRRRFLGERIDVRRVANTEPPAREQAEHATADRGKQAGHVLVARRVGRVKLQGAVRGLGEHAVKTVPSTARGW